MWLDGGGRVDATFTDEGASGVTLLMYAALYGHEQCVRLLRVERRCCQIE